MQIDFGRLQGESEERYLRRREDEQGVARRLRERKLMAEFGEWIEYGTHPAFRKAVAAIKREENINFFHDERDGDEGQASYFFSRRVK